MERKVAERKLFGCIFDSAHEYERPKYGGLNFLNNPKGIESAYYYGTSYFLLKHDVRKRVSITNQDSLLNDIKLGSLDNCLEIINDFTKDELIMLINTAKGSEIKYSECPYL